MADTIGRAYVSIEVDARKLTEGINATIRAMGEIEGKAKNWADNLAKRTIDALNPTAKLEDAIVKLGRAHHDTAPYIKLHAEQIVRAGEVARAAGQPVSKLFQDIEQSAQRMIPTQNAFEKLGNTLTDFARNPVEAAKAGLASMLERLGPTAVGIGAIGAAAVTATVGIAKLAEDLADGAVALRNQAMAAGVTAQEFQALNRIGVETGVNTDSLARMMGMLNRELATGQKMDFVKVLNALRAEAGEGAADLSHGVIPVLDDLGKRLAMISNESQRAELINAAFNRRLQELGVLTVLTKGHLQDYIDTIIKSGAAYSEKTQTNLLSLRESIVGMGREWQAVKIDAVDYFSSILEWATKAAKGIPGSLRGIAYGAAAALGQAPKEWYSPPTNEQEGPPTMPVPPGPPGAPADATKALREQGRAIELAKLLHDGITENIGALLQLAEAEKEYDKAINAGLGLDAQKWGARVAFIKANLEASKKLTEEAEKADKLWKEEAKIFADMQRVGHAALVPTGAEVQAGLKKNTEDAKKALDEYAAIQKSISRSATESKLEELRLQKEIVDSQIPMNDREREAVEIRKVQLETEIRAEEMRVRFAQVRWELEERIAKLSTTSVGGMFAAKLKEQLEQLDTYRDKKLSELEQVGAAQVLKAHRQEYLRMVDTIKDGAGQVFDAMVARGKGAFANLADWIEATFLTKLRQIFQNLMQAIFAPQQGQGFFSTLFQNVLPKAFSSGSAPAMASVAAMPSIGIPGVYQMGAGVGAAAGTGPGLASTMGTLAVPVGIGGFLGANIGGKWGALAGGLGGLGIMGGMSALGTGALTGGVIGTGFGGFMGGMAAMFTNPITAAIAGAIGATLLGIKFASGKNAYQAGGMESLRDFGVSLSKADMKTFLESKGISESTAYPIRKDIESSPAFLTQLGTIAKQQGTYDAFLAKLEKVTTSWGTFNFRKAYEIGDLTGDWTALDKAFTDAFSNSKALQQNLPNWKEILTVTGDAAKKAAAEFESLWSELQKSGEWSEQFTEFLTQNAAALDTAAKSSTAFADQLERARAAAAKFAELKPDIQGFGGLKTALEQISGTAQETIYQSFLKTGKITDELAAKIREFGGDLATFQRLADLSALNTKFADLVQTFNQTGEILPELRELFKQFGGDLTVLDKAAELPGLQKGLASLNSLTSGIQSLLGDPIQKILSGEWTKEAWGALSNLGLDPRRLTGLADLAKFESGWDAALNEFYTGVRHKWDQVQQKYVDVRIGLTKGGLLEQALYQFGGTAGTNAIQQYARGFNVITPDLLSKTKAAMDQSYQDTLKASLEYLQTAQDAATEQIKRTTSDINAQLTTVAENISAAIADAATPVVAQLELILTAINQVVANTANGTANIPAAAGGGLVEVHDGEAILHREQTRNLLQGESSNGSRGTTVVINGPVYGFEDFVRAVERAGIQLRQRGTRAYA